MGKAVSKESPRKTYSVPALDSTRNDSAAAEVPQKNRSDIEKLGASATELDLPDDATIEAEFNRFVMDLGLTEEKAAAMMALQKERKWILVRQHQSKSQQNDLTNKRFASANELGQGGGSSLKSPSEYIEILKSKPTIKVLARELLSLDVALRTLAISWVAEFVQCQGPDVLLQLFRETSLKLSLTSDQRDLQHHMIRCFRTGLMNNSVGLKAMMEHADGIKTLALGIDCENVMLKSKVLEILGAVCLVSPNGPLVVLEALDYYKSVKREAFRFQSIVSELHAGNSDYQTAALVFINSITNASDDALTRINIRLEFINLGLLDAFKTLEQSKDAALHRQLVLFEEQAQADFQEISVPIIDCGVVTSGEPSAIFSAIQAGVADADSIKCLIQLLQQLYLLMASTGKLQSYHLRLLNALIQEIYLQRHKLRLDYQKINLNLQDFIDRFARQNELERLKRDLRIAKTKLENVAKNGDVKDDSTLLSIEVESLKLQLEDEQQRNVKLEADMKSLLDKLEQHTREIQELKAEKDRFLSSLPALSSASIDKGTVASNDAHISSTPTQVPLAPPLPPVLSTPSSAKTSTPTLSAPTGSSPSMKPPLPPSFTASKIVPSPARNSHVPAGKTRQLQWTKIPSASIGKTVWANLGENQKVENSIDFDELEALFSAEKDVSAPKGNSELDIAKEKAKEATLLDSKKAYNIAIMLSRVKMSFSELRKAIMRMDGAQLSDQLVKQLLTFIPTAEEQALLQENIDQLDNYGKAEQFYVEMSKINRYEQRLKAIMFCKHFKEKVADITPHLETMSRASTEVTGSKKFCEVLEILLYVGNFLNSNTFRGNVSGFRLEILTKVRCILQGDSRNGLVEQLSDMRATRGSFLNYLEGLIGKKFQHLQDFPTDLSSVEGASKVSYSNTQEEYVEIEKGIHFLKEESQSHTKPHGTDDKFLTVVKSFLSFNTADFESLSDLKSRTDQLYSRALATFGEDPKTSPEVFFGIFASFLQAYERARLENKKLADRSSKMDSTKSSTARLITSIPKIDANETRRGVMDDLISSLKTGDAIATRSEFRRQRMPSNAGAKSSVDTSELIQALQKFRDQ